MGVVEQAVCLEAVNELEKPCGIQFRAGHMRVPCMYSVLVWVVFKSRLKTISRANRTSVVAELDRVDGIDVEAEDL
jgi:hypothetical protein